MIRSPADVQIWKVDLDTLPSSPSWLERVLSPEEEDRTRRFHFEKDRKSFSISRALLRILLGEYLKEPPGELVFNYTDYGKPFLKKDHLNLDFNVSHSHGKVLIALAENRRVGVDIEQIREEVSFDSIARRYFSLEESQDILSKAPQEKPEVFYRYWTLKEAFIKAQGKGLSYPLNQFSVRWSANEDRAKLSIPQNPTEASGWSLSFLKTFPGFIGALASEGEPKIEVHLFEEVQNQLNLLKFVKS